MYFSVSSPCLTPFRLRRFRYWCMQLSMGRCSYLHWLQWSAALWARMLIKLIGKGEIVTTVLDCSAWELVILEYLHIKHCWFRPEPDQVRFGPISRHAQIHERKAGTRLRHRHVEHWLNAASSYFTKGTVTVKNVLDPLRRATYILAYTLLDKLQSCHGDRLPVNCCHVTFSVYSQGQTGRAEYSVCSQLKREYRIELPSPPFLIYSVQ